MKSFWGSVLLIVGTVVGAIAAASTERAWRRVPLDRVPLGDPEVVLFADVPLEPPGEREADRDEPVEERDDAQPADDEPDGDASDGELATDDVPEREPSRARSAGAGEPVTAEVVQALRARGEQSVRVRRRAQSSEQVAVDEQVGGRILAERLFVDAESGAVVPQAEVERRLGLAGAAREALAGAEPDAAPSVYLTYAEDEGWNASLERVDGADAVVGPLDLEPLDDDARLAGLPPMRELAPEGRFIDAQLARTLGESGLEQVAVSVPKPAFSLATWPGLIPFAASIVAMIAGVVLMRAGSREGLAAVEAEEAASEDLTPGERLAAIVSAVRDLAERAEDFGAREIVERIEPVLAVECLAFVEARDRLRLELGGAGYAAVMAPFATGERRLSRAWSAGADGHPEEARASLEEAVEPFEQALAALAERRREREDSHVGSEGDRRWSEHGGPEGPDPVDAEGGGTEIEP